MSRHPNNNYKTTLFRVSFAPGRCGQEFDSGRVLALLGCVGGMRRLLGKKGNSDWLLNWQDEWGRTLAMYACLCDRLAMLKFLLSKGANLANRDNKVPCRHLPAIQHNPIQLRSVNC